MKKIISLILTAVLIISVTSCSNSRHGLDDYGYMYDVTEDWNSKHGDNRDNLFGYGERLYNSHLILFPREAPDTLTSFYFDWQTDASIDRFAISFTCKLSEDSYNKFITGLDDFEIVSEGLTLKPLIDTDNFFGTAYILQWMDRGEDGVVAEYIILDDNENAVVFNYTVGMQAELEKNTSYTVTPTGDVLAAHYPEDAESFIGFSVYSGFEAGVYNIDFLSHLNKR